MRYRLTVRKHDKARAQPMPNIEYTLSCAWQFRPSRNDNDGVRKDKTAPRSESDYREISQLRNHCL